MGDDITDKVAIQAAVGELQPAGYRAASEAKAKDLLGLPRVQEHIRQSFAAAGLDDKAIADRLKRIVEGSNDEVALRAIELAIKATTGFAPTKSAHLVRNENAGSDRFFHKGKFTAPGRPSLTAPVNQE